MIFLDVDDDFFVADNRAELAATLVRLLPDLPDDETLAYLAAAVLGVEMLDVVVVEQDDTDLPGPSDLPGV